MRPYAGGRMLICPSAKWHVLFFQKITFEPGKRIILKIGHGVIRGNGGESPIPGLIRGGCALMQEAGFEPAKTLGH
jgi:hypothetical protein